MSAAAAAIERLRDRLIDHPADDRLLNFRHDGDAAVLRVVGEPPNRLFARAQDQRPLAFEPVPTPSEREIRAFQRDSGADPGPAGEDALSTTRPDAARWARHEGWAVSYELPIEGDASRRGDHALRVLLHPDQLDARLRRLRSDARLAIEESGSNLLYLAFGFLEWRELPSQSEAEERPALLAPLVLMPARIDSATSRRNVRGFTMTGSGEDLQPNLSLKRKLAADFAIDLPDFAEDDAPETYFHRVRQAIAGQDSWRIRRFVTLALVPDVGKSLLYRDLDPTRWPDGAKPADHPVVRMLIGGAGQPADRLLAEPDEAAMARAVDLDLCLVDRADETQARAVLRALGGDSLVIQGPPGTGKSQTITNLIAAALDRDATVLFVAQKLAALDVVKRRLREARLGAFCLELHGRKARKRAFYADLKERLGKRAEDGPGGIDDALSTLAALRGELDSYISVLPKPAGRTGMTIADLLFEAGRVRAEDENLSQALDIARVPERVGEAVDVLGIEKYSDAETMRILGRVARAHVALDPLGGPLGCPWRGVENAMLAIAAEPVMQAVAAWRDKAVAAAAAISELNRETGLDLASDSATFEQLKGLADGRVDLSVLSAIAAELQRELGRSADFDLPLATGFAGLRVALRVLKLVAVAPVGQLIFSHPGLDSPYAVATLARLAERLKRRAEILQALSGEIAKPDEAGLDETALRAAGRLLVEAGSLARFDRDWREARRFARSLAPPGAAPTAKAEGEALLLLAERVAIDAEIVADPEIREVCDSHFRGAATDVDGLRRAWEWRRAVGDEFGARRDHRLRETLAAAGRGEIIEIRERTSGPIARLGAIVGDIIDADTPPALNDFWAAIAREITPGILADALAKCEGEASVAALMRCVVAAAVAGRELRDAQGQALAALQIDAAVWFGSPADIAAEQIAERADAAVKHPEGLALWLAYAKERRGVGRPGAAALVEAMAEGIFEPDQIGQAWRVAWLTHAARRLHISEPALLRFDGPQLDDLRREYARLDAAVIELRRRSVAARLMRRRAPEGVRGTRTRDMTELALLAHCAALERRQPAIRDVIARAGNALQAIKPCFIMGPLAVAQYLAPGALGFDLVIIDEASQIRPEVALGAVARGGRVVVVGDDMQLPPTSLFDRIAASEVGAVPADAGQDDDSLLTLANARLPAVQGRLRRHYRAQRPELIAFSNCHFYNNEMVFMPTPDEGNRSTVLTHIAVRQGVTADGVNDAEARRVAQAAVDQLRTRPDQSLMVVAMNARQQELIESHIARLEMTSRGSAELLEAAEADVRIEPFVVKHLENIQGDQRDVVMISMTYGPPEPGGPVPQDFGSIGWAQGDRRLNVLATRAREQLVVFASMRAGDVEAGPDSGRGSRMLQRLLHFAETKELPDAPRLSGKLPESPFEVVLLREFERAGCKAEPQLGAGAYRIDVAVRNPEMPEQFLLAIESDGPVYHHALSARDRDRLRPQALQNLGWELERIWSVDWFRQPRAEVQRILDRLDALRQRRRSEGPVREELTRFLPEPAPARPGQVGPRLPRGLTREETRLALIALRERIERELPDADPARGLLRQNMIEELLRRRPTEAGEWAAKIPAELRDATDSAQLSRYGRDLFAILAGTSPVPAS